MSRRLLRVAVPVAAVVLAGALAAVAVVATSGDGTTPPTQQATTPATRKVPERPGTVTVDVSHDLGPLSNPADFQNQSGPAYPLGPKDFERVAALDPKVVRAWFKPDHYYDPETREFDFDYPTIDGTTDYDYLDQVAAQGTILGNFDQCNQKLMRLDDPAECRWVLKAGLLHYKKRYPSLRYIELFNEPDKTWKPTSIEQPAVPLDDYYSWYQIGYDVVNEVNAELKPGVPLELGGPSSYTFNTSFLKGFLDRYRADTNPAKKLAFLSYHQYKQRERPADVANERDQVRSWLRERKLDENRPVFVTEYGVFPGPNTGTTFEADLLTQAAGMATIGRYYAYSGMDMYLHWVYDHLDNERKSMLVDEVDGDVYPYYNLVLMQRMLGPRLIPSESTILDEAGIGVSALATASDDRIAVLLTNYQWTNGTDAHDVTLALRNLPPALTGGEVSVERYLVDAVTSNRTHDPATQGLQKVEDYDAVLGRSPDLSLHLGVNAMSLVVISRQAAS
ncbi:hypothetical protein AB0J82_01850 [Asanoa sp. NPDC049518]|uniref:hypothetical protein n=1 Tax=unclassified Asanoa TaxID=2685164 RepID=UPI00341F10A4